MNPVLAVDLGGTKALFGVFDPGAPAAPLVERRFACADFDGFEPMLARFFAELAGVPGGMARPTRACIAMAGPVEGRRARLTNLPWALDAAAIERAFGLAYVTLVNDFFAAATGIEALGPGALRELQRGIPDGGSVHGQARVVIGAGTGLGVAIALAAGGRWHVVAGEGGHVGFAPRAEPDVALWRHFARRHGRVSNEHVASGAGLVEIYRFLRGPERTDDGDALLLEADPAAAIAARALAPGDDSLAARALDRFASVFGAAAGDVALLSLPRGGVYVAGGIAPKVLDARRASAFVDAFVDKGPHSALMRTIPVRLVTEPSVGLLGAALIAARAGGSPPPAAAA